MEQQERQCANCRFYSAHYIKYKAHLRQVGGQCFNPKVKTANPQSACKEWESDELQKLSERRQILSDIKDMQKRLEEIAMILKDG